MVGIGVEVGASVATVLWGSVVVVLSQGSAPHSPVVAVVPSVPSELVAVLDPMRPGGAAGAPVAGTVSERVSALDDARSPVRRSSDRLSPTAAPPSSTSTTTPVVNPATFDRRRD